MMMRILKRLPRINFSTHSTLVSCLLVSGLLFGCDATDVDKVDQQEDVVVPEQISERPNIIFILLDDLGFGDVGYLGSEIKTPNIDQLAASGVTLDRGYAFPICSPTRAALMTGQNPIKFGIDGPMENDSQLPAGETLLPEYFHRAGYETWMVGKWHLGMAKKSAMPHSRGFDHFYGFLGGFIDFYTHVYFGGLDWQKNGESLREEGYATELLTNETLRLLNQHQGDKPFFLYLSYNSPHTPLQYPPSVSEKYDDIESGDRRVFAQMTTDVDAAIGQVVTGLEQNGLLENTLIVFMSDNGGNLEAGAHNGMLRKGKGSAYEGGVRVPAFVTWPSGLQSNQNFSQPLFVQDWLPTLLEVSGIDYAEDEFDGRSVWQGLTSNKSVERKTPVIIGTKNSKAVYDWPWKLVRNQAKSDNSSAAPQIQNELYNIEADPLEANDLAAEQPDVFARLGAILDELPARESKGAKGPPPESLFRNASGGFDYEIRKPETRKPWAESATD